MRCYMKEPLISVIIPMYNAEVYIKKCIASVTKQLYENIEIIIIDDGSTDNSYKICEGIKNLDNRIILLYQKNSGVSNARNTGLKKANGKYVTFVDADDYIDEEYLQSLYYGMVKLKVDAMICDYYYEIKPSKKKYKSGKSKVFSSKEAIINMLNTVQFDSSICCKLFLTEMAKNILFKEKYCIAEDLLFNYYLFKNCKKIGYLDQKYYHYVQHSNSAIHSALTHKKIESLKVFEELLGDCQDKEIQYAIISKYISICFNFLSLSLSEVGVQDLNYIKGIIKQYRKKIIGNNSSNRKVRYACVISYMGFNTVNRILTLYKAIIRGKL